MFSLSSWALSFSCVMIVDCVDILGDLGKEIEWSVILCFGYADLFMLKSLFGSHLKVFISY